jgi:hypothetical protein
VHEEAMKRGYRFDAAKINHSRAPGQRIVTSGQLQFEWSHLMEKLKTRSPDLHAKLFSEKTPQLHPLFRVVDGEIAELGKRCV